MYGNYAPFYRGGFFNPMQTPTMPNMTENQNQWQLQNMQQPLNQPMQNNPVTMPQTPTNDMIFVLNENEASSFPVAPNNRVVLWDKNQTTFYVKSANAQGIPSMQIFDFSERTQKATQTPTEHVCKCGDNFVTKDDFNALKGDFEALTKRFEETAVTQVTKAPKTTKKGDD
jgi:hypothetical protein